MKDKHEAFTTRHIPTLSKYRDILGLKSRTALLDPQNGAAHAALQRTRTRLFGQKALWSTLSTTEQWQNTQASAQDYTISQIAHLISQRMDLHSIKTWSCPVLDVCGWCRGTGLEDIELHQPHRGFYSPPCTHCEGKGRIITAVNSYRLATFIHRISEIEFQLIPGAYHVDPFLIARWPLTRLQAMRLGLEGWPPPRELDKPVASHSRERVAKTFEEEGLRFPMEREWLHACAAGTYSKFYWGHVFDKRYAWVSDNAKPFYDNGSRIPWKASCIQSMSHHEIAETWNAFGLVDMMGNVWEAVTNNWGEQRIAGHSHQWEVLPDNRDPLPHLTAAHETFVSGFRPAMSLPM